MKPNLYSVQIITNGDMSQATVTSSIVDIHFLDNICLQLNFTGTPVGTFSVQVSADYLQDANGNVLRSGNWVALTLSPSPAASGSASQIAIDINQTSFPYMRVVYTKTSSTGTLNAFLGGKMI